MCSKRQRKSLKVSSSARTVTDGTQSSRRSPTCSPMSLRNGKDDLPFLKKYKDKFPKTTLEKGKPFNEKNL